MDKNKKILVSIIIFSLLNYVGCSSIRQIQKEELLSSVDKDIIVKINKHDTYWFEEGNYIVRNDSIIGNGKLKQSLNGYTELNDYKGGVALKDVKEISIDEVDVSRTIVLTTVLVLFFVLVVITTANFHPSLK